MKCPKCGSDRPAEARFCSECGTSLVDSTGDTTTMPSETVPARMPYGALFLLMTVYAFNMLDRQIVALEARMAADAAA